MFYWNLLYYISIEDVIKGDEERFNPCFIGTYSITYYKVLILYHERGVLILVLLELTLLHMLKKKKIQTNNIVLILVLLELTLLLAQINTLGVDIIWF